MRWNHKIGTFTVLLALGITMAGCGASSSTAGSTAASTPSTTSSEAQEAQKTEVQPMQGVLLSDPLSDGTYHISFESDKVWVGERKNTINDAVVYDYDRYTAPEIEALSEGDTIVTHLNGTEETTALTVESIELTSTPPGARSSFLTVPVTATADSSFRSFSGKSTLPSSYTH